MKGFEIELWHAVVFFLTILIGVFKNEIVSTIYSFTTIWGKTHLKDQKVQIQSASGEWKEVKIVNYKHEIPFIKEGGVLIRHEDDDENIYEEIISFTSWKTLRIRHLVSKS